MNLLRKVGVLNVLLIFVPVALALRYGGAEALWIFAASAVAIIPLAGLMGKSTEMLAERLGPGIGGLLNASFGNAAELIIALFALRKGLVEVVKASITGSILGNVLLVLGASLLAGGLKYRKQTFNSTAAGMAATLLALAAIGLLVPALFHGSVVVGKFLAEQQGKSFPTDVHEREVSLEISIVLFAVYALMLVFSLKTHRHLYDGARGSEEAAPGGDLGGTRQEGVAAAVGGGAHASSVNHHWSASTATTVLLVATLFVAWMSELLVGAIEATREQLGWSELFVGVVVVAIVGNAAEHSTAILVAMKNQMDLSFQIAVGSALQIALFVAPVLVFVSYLPGMPELNLVFSTLEVAAVAASVGVVGLVAYDGQTNWLEGLLLLAVYVILAIAFYYLPVLH